MTRKLLLPGILLTSLLALPPASAQQASADATAETAAHAAVATGQLAERYAELAGSTEAAAELVEGMRVDPATGAVMGYGEIDQALALSGAMVESGATTTLDAGVEAVMQLRADGMAWGGIARELGVNPGDAVSAAHRVDAAVPAGAGAGLATAADAHGRAAAGAGTGLAVARDAQDRASAGADAGLAIAQDAQGRAAAVATTGIATAGNARDRAAASAGAETAASARVRADAGADARAGTTAGARGDARIDAGLRGRASGRPLRVDAPLLPARVERPLLPERPLRPLGGGL